MTALNPAAEFDYSPRVRELFADLRHAGVLSVAGATPASPCGDLESQDAGIAPAIASAQAGSHEQGAQVRLQAEIIAGRMQTIRYQAYGCPHFLAACESLARCLEGRRIRAGHEWSRNELEIELALPAHKRARLLILEDALHRLLAQVAHSVPGV